MLEEQTASDAGAPSDPLSLTASVAERVAATGLANAAGRASTVAKQCLLDWIGVTLAARDDPIASTILDMLVEPSRRGVATLFGRSGKARALDAALLNGAMGHALDYDDVLRSMGHPTAPVAPAVFALGEQRDASGAEVLDAFIAGVEAESRIGLLMAQPHYAAGWHTTATVGTFGAAAAAGRLLGLDTAAMAQAFGLCGVQAAGLKGAFGTMSKPLQVGRAAQNGLAAALLAARGFTSDDDTLDAPQGFARVLSRHDDLEGATRPAGRPHVADVLFKYHAACYLTHNTIEAASTLRRSLGVALSEIVGVEISVLPRHMTVCNIEAPATGLECKFSLRMTCALALAGEDTSDEKLFSDRTAGRPDLRSLCRLTVVRANAATNASAVTLHLRDGSIHRAKADVMQPAQDLDAQQALLERKFRSLTRGVLSARAADEVIGLCRELEHQPSLGPLMARLAGG